MMNSTSILRWKQNPTPRKFLLPMFLCLAVALAGTQVGYSDEPAAPSKLAPAVSSAPVATWGLAECLQMALQRQPAVAAQRASLAVAQDGLFALKTLPFPASLSHELPIRRQQAALGVNAAIAGVDRSERETVYSVTRTFFTVVYAREQERVARGVGERLSGINEAASQQLKEGARDVTAADVDRTSVYLELAQTRRLQAALGVERALAALREAMGLGSEFQLEVPYGPLPEPELQISRDEIIAAALARQSNLVRAVLFAKITGLEINAQRTSHHFQMDTFAAGGDIHSSQVEQGSHNSEYRVGAPLPEMPVKLVGSRDARVRRACSLNLRAQALVEKARNLVILEADNAFREWEEAAQQIPHVRKAATTGDRFADNLRKDFTAGLKVRVEEVINAQVLASQARAQYNEILFQQILALAKLEQITAGGFSAGLGWPPSIPVQVSGGNGKSASASGPR